jgi:hypothetical protein
MILFERVYLARVVYSVCYTALFVWPRPATPGSFQDRSPSLFFAVVIIGTVVSVVISLLLVIFAARKASRNARRIIFVFFLLACTNIAIPLISGEPPIGLLPWLYYLDLALRTFAVWLIYKGKDADRWFAGTWQRIDVARVFE